MTNINDNNIENTFMEQYPIALKGNNDLYYLAVVFAKQIKKIISKTKCNMIYCCVDSLQEDVLDMLAIDFKVDWYNTSADIEAKRNMIKDCIKVHKHKGTAYAVEVALKNVHQNSTVEEWFEYGGKPYFFRIVQDVSNKYEILSYDEILKTIAIYKRLSAHLESVIYQCAIVCAIKTNEHNKIYTLPLTGTIPYRSTNGSILNTGMTGIASIKVFGYNLKLCGSKRRL
ncbi:MAG: phage tail protein I [Clostridia bacterium]|nr:phage tail protein I [Clostridia bacterium]